MIQILEVGKARVPVADFQPNENSLRQGMDKVLRVETR